MQSSPQKGAKIRGNNQFLYTQKLTARKAIRILYGNLVKVEA